MFLLEENELLDMCYDIRLHANLNSFLLPSSLSPCTCLEHHNTESYRTLRAKMPGSLNAFKHFPSYLPLCMCMLVGFKFFLFFLKLKSHPF